MLVRFDGLEFIRVTSEGGRGTAYWAHVLAPLACVWLYILHRLAGPRIKWRVGIGWALAVAAVSCRGRCAGEKHNAYSPSSNRSLRPSIASRVRSRRRSRPAFMASSSPDALPRLLAYSRHLYA